jgi:hypothetical protein
MAYFKGLRGVWIDAQIFNFFQGVSPDLLLFAEFWIVHFWIYFSGPKGIKKIMLILQTELGEECQPYYKTS